jgi:hypothetical protein
MMAQLSLAVLYELGRGVPKNKSKAIKWFTKAALQGSPIAFNYVKKYAVEGHLLAQSNLGIIHINGQGIMKDFQEARNWLQKAADSGSAEAQYNLGVVFERGLGTPIDIELARKWYKEAASQGFDKAIEKLKN